MQDIRKQNSVHRIYNRIVVSSCSKTWHKKPVDRNDTKKTATKAAPKISAFFQKESIGEVLSKLAALDGFSFNALTKSTFIRSAMTEKGYDFPKNHKQAIKLVKYYFASVKTELKISLTHCC